MSKEIRRLVIVEIKISTDEQLKISRLVQTAQSFGAKTLYNFEEAGYTRIGFETENPDILQIMLNN